MALKGTLKDFGIGDILQLIGQQQKTGTLFLRDGEQEVQVGFKDGSIVKVESSTRKRKELIGAMLVRAGLINEVQLEAALETQSRTLKRLGDVLVSARHLDAERFQRMMQLQATETLYRLFSWKSGTYEFGPGEVELEADVIQPLRAESVLMEGFRMVDEWPQVRRLVSDPAMTFVKLKELTSASLTGRDAFEDSFDDAFNDSATKGKDKGGEGGEFRSLGEPEERIFALVQPGRDVSRLVDLSCLGEFETCKALCNLVNLGYLRPVYPHGRRTAAQGGGVVHRLAQLGGRFAVSLVLMAVLALVGSRLQLDSFSLGQSPASSYADPAAQRLLWHGQRTRIVAALEVFRLERGELPERLEALVDAGLLAREDLRYPWRDEAYYRRLEASQFVLLPPLR